MVARKFPYDLTGLRFGRLVVLGWAAKKPTCASSTLWECRCDCGETKAVWRTGLVSGRTKSCGCWHSEIARAKALGNDWRWKNQRPGPRPPSLPRSGRGLVIQR